MHKIFLVKAKIEGSIITLPINYDQMIELLSDSIETCQKGKEEHKKLIDYAKEKVLSITK